MLGSNTHALTKFCCISLISLTLLMLSPRAFSDKAHVILYADDNYPPYAYLENGSPKGIYTDIIREASRYLTNFEIQIEAVPWKRGLLMLQNGSGFALYPPYRRIKQRPFIYPYSVPILKETVVVYCREGIISNHQLANWPDDFNGLIVGYNAGFLSGGDDFLKGVKKGRYKAKAFKGNRESILAMSLGRIDCYMNDRFSIEIELNKLRNEGTLKPWYDPIHEVAIISSEHGYLGYTNVSVEKYPYKSTFIDEFNNAIEMLKKQGRIQAIVEQYTMTNSVE